MTRSIWPIYYSGALWLLAGCTGPEGESESGKTLTVDALEVITNASPGGAPSRLLNGRFEIRAPMPGEQSIQSNGRGGACLLAQVPVEPKSCSVDAQCNIERGSGHAKWHGYCLHGSCWVKPSEAYCLKGQGEGSHAFPTTAVDTSEVYSYVARQMAGLRPVPWKVVGCLNGVGPNEHAPPTCAGWPGDVLLDEGQPTIVP